MRAPLVVSCLLVAFAATACDTPTETAAFAGPQDAIAPRFADGGSRVVAAATGSAHFETAGAIRNVTFSATRRADGSVEGEAEIVIHGLDAFWHIRVECVTVVDNRAFLGGTITSASDDRLRIGAKSYFWVEDHGRAGDRVSIAGFNETPEGLADFCELRQNLLRGTDVLQGDVTVRSSS